MPFQNKCPECGSSSLINDYDRGETICTECGLVIKEQEMDRGPEWRAFTFQERETKSRVGCPENISRHDKGLFTIISPSNRDAYGRGLSLSTISQIYRLRKWQGRIKVSSVKGANLLKAMGELERLSDKLSLPASVKKYAAYLYRNALKEGLIRGRTIQGMVTAAVYIACRKFEIPRTLNEISEVSMVDKKSIAKNYRILLRKLDLKVPIASPQLFISKIAGIVGISAPSQKLAIMILQEAQKRHIQAGKDPIGFAAAALYIACRITEEQKTQKEIAETADVTEVTIRNRYKEIQRKLELPLKSQFIEEQIISPLFFKKTSLKKEVDFRN